MLVLSYAPQHAQHPSGPQYPMLFLVVLLMLVIAARMLALRVASQSGTADLASDSAFFHRLMSTAKLGALLWTAAGLYYLGWGPLILSSLPPSLARTTVVPAALLITLPSYIAWLGLYWAQYPADVAHREQIIVHHLDLALPVRQPPDLRQYLDHHLRTGPGMLLLPVLTVMTLRDVVSVILHVSGITPSLALQNGIVLGTMALGFALFPILLVRILRTSPLPEGPLRARLELLASRAGVRIAKVLVWNTGNSMANAMVTGVLPRFRYVLISDFLLESLDDEHIEAVFAHELGHVVHRHLAWYLPFVVSMAVLTGWLDFPLRYIRAKLPGPVMLGDALELVVGVVALIGIFLLWGMLSRRFERQADVFAARSLGEVTAPARVESQEEGEIPGDMREEPVRRPPLKSVVAMFGATLFSDALRKVALLNNMPITGRNFTHGSIQSRLSALQGIAQRPENTPAFDARMRRVRALLVLTILAGLVSLFFVEF